MEIIPLIKTQKKNIVIDGFSDSKELLEHIDENSLLYILDIDGIEKDKPNLCTYQKLSKSYDIWVDFGPRNLGDVVDAFMAGATRITIRKEHYRQLDIQSIREITENKVYANIDLDNQKSTIEDDSYYPTTDGVVNFNDKTKIEQDYKYSDFLKKIGLKNMLFSYESDPLNISFWKNFKIEGLIVDIKKQKEFDNYAF